MGTRALNPEVSTDCLLLVGQFGRETCGGFMHFPIGMFLRLKLAQHVGMRPVGRRWRVFVCGPQHSAQIELGPDFLTGGDIKGADFVLNLGEFYCHDLNAPVFVEIAREDVVYARIYDMRSRSVSGQFEDQPLQ